MGSIICLLVGAAAGYWARGKLQGTKESITQAVWDDQAGKPVGGCCQGLDHEGEK